MLKPWWRDSKEWEKEHSIKFRSCLSQLIELCLWALPFTRMLPGLEIVFYLLYPSIIPECSISDLFPWASDPPWLCFFVSTLGIEDWKMLEWVEFSFHYEIKLQKSLWGINSWNGKDCEHTRIFIRCLQLYIEILYRSI